MDDDYMLHKVLVKIKELKGIEKLDDTNIFVDTNDKLLDDITLEKCCNINDIMVLSKMTVNFIRKYF